ncbi:hypothetical protein Tcan_18182 [Toxocara canis]|uniref:SERTA domain-containing protein n=2 Tax=Toxocara canis TaxID=6265 RepID=A0A0B2UY57_TOXCA|nr:hypothetical protein Tcan_18182 [Toxocara canis]VDM38010.1 unnamed protein product [Toxocara canis]
MMNSTSDVDEMIENEVCSRLIRLSCAKMVNSKHERGGAKLHRNLLILHLLRRARNEQKRSAPSSLDSSDNCPELSAAQAVVESSERADDSDDDEVDVEQCDKSTGHLLDLSCSSRSYIAGIGDPVELTVRDDDEVDYSALRLEPLQLPFGTDVIEAEELTELSKPSLLVVPELSPDLCGHLPLIAPDQHQAQLQHSAVGMASVVSAGTEMNEHPPVCFLTSEEEHDPSSSSGSEEEEDENMGEQSPSQRRRRKRKTSTPRTPAPSTAKKCCMEERQLTGLISVFNSGLSVVADQLMARSQPNTLLQPASDQLVPSLMRIACNPLICQ